MRRDGGDFGRERGVRWGGVWKVLFWRVGGGGGVGGGDVEIGRAACWERVSISLVAVAIKIKSTCTLHVLATL